MTSHLVDPTRRKRQRAFILSLIPLFIFCYMMYLGEYRSAAFLFGFGFDAHASSVCASLNVSKLWRIGNQASTLVKHLSENTSLSINSQHISAQKTHVWSSLDEILVDDLLGLRIGLGTRNSIITACTDTTGLQAGKHIVTIETRTTMGEAYSYWWEITVP